MIRNKYNVEQAVQFILKPGDESELSDLDEDDDHDEISACNIHRVEIEDDIEGDDINEEQVNDNHERNTSKEKVQDSTLNQPAKKKKSMIIIIIGIVYPHLFLIRHLVGKSLMYHQKILKS